MKTDRELTINELDTVSGGADTCKTIAVCFNFTHFQPGGDGGEPGGDGEGNGLELHRGRWRRQLPRLDLH